MKVVWEAILRARLMFAAAQWCLPTEHKKRSLFPRERNVRCFCVIFLATSHSSLCFLFFCLAFRNCRESHRHRRKHCDAISTGMVSRTIRRLRLQSRVKHSNYPSHGSHSDVSSLVDVYDFRKNFCLTHLKRVNKK